MFVVRTTIPVNPDHRETAIEYVSDLMDYSRREDGTVRYHATTDIEDPNLLRFFEQYEDVAAAETHTESEPYRRFNEVLPEFVDGTIETIQFEADDVSVTEFTAADAVEALD